MRVECIVLFFGLCLMSVFGQYYGRDQGSPGIFPSSYSQRLAMSRGYLPWYIKKRLGENRRTPPIKSRSYGRPSYKQYHPWQVPVFNQYRGYGF
ncbi:hypothetical protein SNE40_013857 [Patella caerulea]|uniref:Uncharacterized protein n=1 Tax=Patella caerulea TaxID=87958 RepID=A0AAN8JCF2_PATCE